MRPRGSRAISLRNLSAVFLIGKAGTRRRSAPAKPGSIDVLMLALVAIQPMKKRIEPKTITAKRIPRMHAEEATRGSSENMEEWLGLDGPNIFNARSKIYKGSILESRSILSNTVSLMKRFLIERPIPTAAVPGFVVSAIKRTLVSHGNCSAGQM